MNGPSTDGARRRTSWLKALLWVVLVAVAIVVLFTWVFPWVESLQQNPTLGVVHGDGWQEPGQALRAAR